MGQRLAKSEKETDSSEPLPSDVEILKYQRTLQKYEQNRSRNDEVRCRKRREKDPKYKYKKPETLDEISLQGKTV